MHFRPKSVPFELKLMRKMVNFLRKNFRTQSVYTYQASEKQNANFRVILTLIPT